MTVLPTYRPRVRLRPADRSRRHALLITLGMYSCRFQASTDETVNNVTPEAAGSVMGAETPLPGVETIQAASNHVLHNETASGPRVRRLQIGDR